MQKMAESLLRIKSKAFAVNVVTICRAMRNDHVEYSLVDQLMRCGTSIGANIYEAQFAHGTKDFISKFEIALKECNECDYWLDLLKSTNSIDIAQCDKLLEDCGELRKMLISSVTTLKSKN